MDARLPRREKKRETVHRLKEMDSFPSKKGGGRGPKAIVGFRGSRCLGKIRGKVQRGGRKEGLSGGKKGRATNDRWRHVFRERDPSPTSNVGHSRILKEKGGGRPERKKYFKRNQQKNNGGGKKIFWVGCTKKKKNTKKKKQHQPNKTKKTKNRGGGLKKKNKKNKKTPQKKTNPNTTTKTNQTPPPRWGFGVGVWVGWGG